MNVEIIALKEWDSFQETYEVCIDQDCPFLLTTPDASNTGDSPTHHECQLSSNQYLQCPEIDLESIQRELEEYEDG